MAERSTPAPRRIAILMWGDVVEDFLAPIGWTLDEFLTRMSGGWLFGYIDALRLTGIESTLIVYTRAKRGTNSTVHAATGARVRLVQSPLRYRALRVIMRSPYHWLDDDGRITLDIPRPFRPLYAWARDVMPYLATPVDELARVISEEGCEAILCQEYEEARFDAAIAAGTQLGIPVYASFQGAKARRSRREEHVRPASIAAARSLIIGSSQEAARVRAKYGVAASHIARIFNPVDSATWYRDPHPETRRSLGIPDSALIAAWHGRVAMSQKGLDVLLEAWDSAKRELPSLHLLLVGAGEDSAELQRLLALRDGSGITWVNSYIADRAEMRRYLSAADFYVFSSRYEGFAVAPLEAMACGLPLIATEVEGIADMAPRGEEDGIIIVPKDDARAFAAAIVRLARDSVLRERLARGAAHRIAESFSLEALSRSLASLIQRG